MPPVEEVSYDWMDITERGYKTLAQTAIAAGAVPIINSMIQGESVDFSVLYNVMVPIVATGIAFAWNTWKGYRQYRKEQKELNNGVREG